MAVVIILGIFAAFPGRWAWIVQKRVERYETAEAMFQERCKKAGEFIHRTAENVEGVFLLKLRPKGINYGDQYKMDDPYGSNVTGDGYFSIFLYGKDTKGSLVEQNALTNGYRYVDALDPKDGKRYRYTGRIEEPWQRDKSYLKGHMRFVLDKVLAPDPAPRYGVTYDDISTREERDYWIAGSSLKVIDLQTKEVMAERIGYMMDRGQGNRRGGRSPWLLARNHACPSFPKVGGHPFAMYQTRDFVEKVLHIHQMKKDN
jgi:hypothetical protein